MSGYRTFNFVDGGLLPGACSTPSKEWILAEDTKTPPRTARPAKAASAPVPVYVVGGEVSTLGSSDPFWFRIPSVFMGCLNLFLFPFRAILVAAEIALASGLLAFGVAGWMWWTKRITDQDVANVLMEAGDRVLGILKGAGIF